VAFVKLVENDHPDLMEKTVGKKFTGKDAFGQKPQLCATATDFFETNLISNEAAHSFAEFRSDPACREPGRQPPRLQHANMLESGA
jgi:hypothetical protein